MTTTGTAPTLERRTFTRDEFGTEARARFGDDPLDWAFVCPWCGDVATAREFPDGYREYVGQICIGRLPVQFPYAPLVADPARGCHTWTTNFQIDGPWIVTLPDGTAARCFALAPSRAPQSAATDQSTDKTDNEAN